MFLQKCFCKTLSTKPSQLTFTCLKSTIETVEKRVKYVQSIFCHVEVGSNILKTYF